MGFFWSVLGMALMVALFLLGARWAMVGGGRRRVRVGEDLNQDRFPRRDLNANVNPSQTGNMTNLWPDRTGAQTRRELGAKDTSDTTFMGGEHEDKGVRETAKVNQAGGRRQQMRQQNDRTAHGVVQSDATSPAIQPGVRRQAQPGPHEHGPGTQPAADLAPEDKFGEDRPAARTTAVDQDPTQWHPREHGVPGDHYRDGHHRSATAPERQSDATDPYAHAPVPGPNHIPPEAGAEFPDEIRP